MSYFLSFGAGVQSTAMMILAHLGEIKGVEAGIFADTGDEPESVYKHLKTFKSKCSIPIIVDKSNYGSLTEFTRNKKYVPAPVFAVVEGKRKPKLAMGRRQCTSMFKVQVVEKAIRKHLGLVGKHLKEDQVKVGLGISSDEGFRVKKSQTRWIRNVYPLLNLGLSRKDCEKINQDFLGYKPIRSACVYCPYKSPKEFLKMKKSNIKDWNKAVEFDEMIRDLGKGQKNYVLRNRTPLKDLEKGDEKDQGDLFHYHASCDEGGCGL